MAVRFGAPFHALERVLREGAFRLFVDRVLRLGFSAALVIVGAFTAMGITSAFVGAAPFDGVSREVYRLGAYIRMHAGGNGAPYLRQGWGEADEVGRWMRESAAVIEIPSHGLPHEQVWLQIEPRKSHELGFRTLYLDVLVNGVALGRLTLSGQNEVVEERWLPVPGDVIARHKDTLILCLFASPASPRAKSGAGGALVKIDKLRLAEKS
jgi:hypothetical protein